MVGINIFPLCGVSLGGIISLKVREREFLNLVQLVYHCFHLFGQLHFICKDASSFSVIESFAYTFVYESYGLRSHTKIFNSFAWC